MAAKHFKSVSSRHLSAVRGRLSRVVFATGLFCLCCGLELAGAAGQDEQIPAAAWVDGKPIGQDEVEQQVNLTLREREADEATRDMMRAHALERIISQRLIVDFLRKNKLGATEQDVRLALERLTEQLERQQKTLESYLESRKMTRERFEWTLAWQIGWSDYLDRYLTDENLEEFFNERKRLFDGTQREAAHILFRVDESEDENAWKSASEEARKVRQQLTDGELTFEKAATTHSDALSGRDGGAVGWLARDGEMPETFLNALFELEQAEVSEPVRTAYGIHLIRWTNERAGTKTWREGGRRLRNAATEYLFDWVADQQRANAEIRYAQQYPHFDPESGELVIPK